MNKRFIYRQLTISGQQSVLFILCVALSIVSLVALRGFGASINRALLNNARQLTAGDIIIRSNYALSEPVDELIASLAQRGEVASAKIKEFYTVVRTPTDDRSLLVNIKVAEPGYPFYGTVDFASARSFDDAVSAGGVAVEQTLLDRMGIAVGDSLRVGEATLVVRDVVLREPDRPVDFFSLGPRMFVALDDLESLDLVKSGSRVSYSTLLKVDDPSQIDKVAKQITTVLETGQESVDTFRTAESNVQRFYDNFLFFLNVVSIFTLLLAGIGIQSALTAFLRERRTTIAIVKTLGATSKFIYYHFYAIVAIFGAVGMLAGILAGLALQGLLPTMMASLLPPDIELAISGRAVAETVILGVFVVATFTFLPLYRLEELRPSYVFRKEMAHVQKGWPYYAAILVIAAFFMGMVLWQLGKIITGLYFVGGILVLILISALLTEGILRLLQRQRIGKLDVRQAVRGLFRPGNATRSIVVVLSTALGVLYCIFLVEQNLDATFVQSYPEDAPNLFFVDIQPDQLAMFSQSLGIETEYYPVVRASIAGINGERPLDDQRVRDGRDWQFGLTYRDRLLADESVVGGGPLFLSDFDGIQVSVLDEVLDFANVGLGDENHISYSRCVPGCNSDECSHAHGRIFSTFLQFCVSLGGARGRTSDDLHSGACGARCDR